MSRVLILFAHPALEKSRVHRRLIESLPEHPDLTLWDLYEAYPRFDIDVSHEQGLLVRHDVVVFQHPLYWYSTPPMLKQWQDLVLEHGWAYGSDGKALAGKVFLPVLSAGGRAVAYRPDGYNRFTIRQLLSPVEQTARLCGMETLPPFVVFGTHQMDEGDIAAAASRYRSLMDGLLRGELDATQRGELAREDTLNAVVGRWEDHGT